MTLNTELKNWLAQNAGSSNCYVSSGIPYKDPDNISRTGGTGDVLNSFYVAHLLGKDTLTIISGTNYTALKTINGNSDIALDDVKWVYDNDGTPTGEAQYCFQATTGILSFSSSPSGAEIYIDDVDHLKTTGASPVNISVSSGTTHTWKLTLSGYNNATGSQLVTAGQTYTINPTLTAATGSINFVSYPTGANIKLGGVNTGFVTNKQIDNLSAGTYLYILTKEGYADKGGQVEVFAGSVSTVSETLVILPTNAKITLNDDFTGYNCYGFSIPKDEFACASESSLVKVHAIFSTGDCISTPPVNQFIWYKWDLIQLAWTQYIQTPPLLIYPGYCRAEANLPCGNMYKVAYGTTEKIFTIREQSTPPASPAAAAASTSIVPLVLAVGAVVVVGIVVMSGKKA